MDQEERMSAPVLVASSLSVGYDGVEVARAPELSIETGDRVVIAGPNGSGKTTVLKTFARLIPPVSGTLSAPGRGPRGAIYVHSAPFLFAGSGRHNVLLAAGGDARRVDDALEALGAAALSHLDVRTL